jgi:hypothetical protein
MFNVCAGCGLYAVDKEIRPLAGTLALAVCPHCGHGHPFRQLPLFLLTGASGTGKTTLCLELAAAQSRAEPWVPACVYLEQDILWRNEYVDPENGYRAFRDTWLRVAKNVGQAGRPAVLCGSAVPMQFEACPERRYVAGLHCLALICDDDLLRERLLARPEWRGSSGTAFVDQMIAFNRWFREQGPDPSSGIVLLDTSTLSVREAARQVAAWIQGRLREE